jgi:hypothetical protein
MHRDDSDQLGQEMPPSRFKALGRILANLARAPTIQVKIFKNSSDLPVLRSDQIKSD